MPKATPSAAANFPTKGTLQELSKCAIPRASKRNYPFENGTAEKVALDRGQENNGEVGNANMMSFIMLEKNIKFK